MSLLERIPIDRLTPLRLWEALDGETRLTAARALYRRDWGESTTRREADLTVAERQDARSDVVNRLGAAFRYAERPNRFVFGTDWPLVPMAPYRDLIASAIPEPYHDQIFRDNAALLFGLGE